MDAQVIPVGLGEIRVAGAGAVLACYGLGSCVCLALYDPAAQVAGMAHVVLPSAQHGRSQDLPGKYADTALPALVQALVEAGASRPRLLAKMAGGANVLPLEGGWLDIGSRNAEAVRAALAAARIPLVAQDTGGTCGRTVHLAAASGQMRVTVAGRGEKVL